MSKRIFKIGSVDPEITPYNVTNSQTLLLYISIDDEYLLVKLHKLKEEIRVSNFEKVLGRFNAL